MKKLLLYFLLFFSFIRLEAADYYWVGGGGNWSDLTHWRLGSPTGGTPSIIPSPDDNVFFGSYSGFTGSSRTVTLDANAFCNNMTWEADVPNNPLLSRIGSSILYVYGNLALQPSMGFTGNVGVEFTGINPASLTTHGSLTGIFNIIVNKPGSGLTLMDDLIYIGSTTNNAYGLTLTAGYLDASDKTVAVYSFLSDNNNPRHLDITGGNFSAMRNFYFRGANKTIAAEGSYVNSGIRLITDGGEFDEVEATSDSPNNDLFSVYNTTFRKLVFSHPSPSSNARIHAGNTVDSLIFLGQGVVRMENNRIRHLSIAGNGTIGGSANLIQYAQIGGTFNIINNGGHVIDTLYTAPNKNISIRGTITINNHFRAGGAPCDGFTEISGSAAGTIHFADGAIADIDNVLLTNIAATGSITPIPVNGVDNEGNSGFVINTPVMASRTLYWVGGTGDWNDRSHWSESSGGTPGACIPFITDDIVFDGASGLGSGGTVTTTGNTYCHDMTWAADLSGNATFNESNDLALRVYGSVTLNPNVTMNAMLQFVGDQDATLSTNGSSLGVLEARIHKTGLAGAIGKVSLLDDWSNTQARVSWLRGDVDVQDRNLDINVFSGTQSLGGHLNMRDASITVNNWQFLNSSKTVDAVGSYIMAKTNLDIRTGSFYRVESTATTANGFEIANTSIDYLTFSNPALTSEAWIGADNVIGRLEFLGQGRIASGGNVIDSLITAENRNFQFLGGSNTIVKYFKATHPSCSGLGEIRSGGATATLVFGADAEVLIDNVYMENIMASGGGGSLSLPIAFNGVDAGGNNGWDINATTSGSRYWVGGGGDWNDASHWSMASGGPGGACIPTATDDVFFDGNSGFGTGPADRTVTISSGNAYFRNMSWAGAQNNPIWDRSGNWTVEAWGNSITLIPNSVLNQTLKLMGPEHSILYGRAGGDLDLQIHKPHGSLTFADDYSNTNTQVYLFHGDLRAAGKTLTLQTITNEGRDNDIHVDISGATLNLSSWWQYDGTDNNRSLAAENSTINATAVQIDGFVYQEMNISGTGSNHGAMNSVTIDRLTFTHTSINNNIGINGTHNLLAWVEYKGSGHIYGSDNEIGTLIFSPGNVYTFAAGTNTTLTGDWYGSGTPCKLTEIVSGSSTATATVTKTSGAVVLDYIRLSRMTASGGASFSAQKHSIDLGGNIGWDIAPYDGAAPIDGLGPDLLLNARQFPYTLESNGFFGHPESVYAWSREGTLLGTGDQLIVSEPGTYSVSVTFPDGCSVQDDIVITRERADVETVKAAKEPGRTTYAPGTEVVYTLTVTNHGPDTALEVRITDIAPVETTLSAWTATVESGTFTLPNASGTGDLDETIDELPVGAVVVYEVTLATDPGMETDLINTVEVTSITEDPNPGCETCSLTLTASPEAELTVTKTLKDNTQTGYVPGDAVEYIILVSNEGPSDAHNVGIEDTAPEGTGITSWTAIVEEGTVDLPNGSGSGDLDETLAVLPEGAVIRYEITVQTPTDFRDDLINMSEVTSDTEDPDEENNRATTPGLSSVPDAPVSEGDQEACAEVPVQMFTASATVPTGVSIIWYDAPTGGNTVADPRLDSVGTVTYYAEAVKDGLSSETRTAVTLTIYPLPTVVINDPGVVCLPGTVNLTATEVTAGSDAGLLFSYHTDAAGTNALANPETVDQSGTYYIAGTRPDTGCRTVMPVTVRFVDRPEVNVVHPSCVVGTGFIEVVHPIGAGFEYSIDGVNYQVDTEFTGLVPGTSYEVTSRHMDVVGCVSEPLLVTISNNPATETPMVIQPDCGENRGSILFQEDPEYEYSIDNGLTYQISPNFTNLVGGTYLARVRRPSTSCEAEAVEVTVNGEIVLPDAPVSDGNQEACSTDSSLPLMATSTVPGGVDVIWYDAASGGNIVDNPIWSQVGSVTYYAEAYDGTCTSPERTPVTLTIRVAPVPDPVEDVAACEAYILPEITGNDLSGNEAYYSGQGGTGDRYHMGETITDPGTRILYIYDVTDDGCEGETSFELTINEVLPGGIGTDQTIRFNEVPEPIRSVEDGTGMGSVEYRWEWSADGASWTTIAGATGETYQAGALIITMHYRRFTTSTGVGGTPCESAPTDPVTITVLDGDAPLAQDDLVWTPVGSPVTFDPLGNDVAGSYPLDPTSVRLIDPGTGATVAFLDIPGEGSWRVEVNTGEVTFSPLEGFDQETTAIGYMVRDTQGTEGDPALLMVRMAKRPRAVEDTSLTATGSGGPAGNVLDNDFLGDGPADPDDLVLTFEDPDNTGITVDARGNVQVPTGLEPGVHTLSYTLCNMVFPELCDTASVMLTVELEALVVHNVISPNGDGTNDHLIIKGIEAYPDNVLEIFNRWGVQVFKTVGYNNRDHVFDGSSQARMTLNPSNGIPAGTYYYILNYQREGEAQTKMGWLYIQNND